MQDDVSLTHKVVKGGVWVFALRMADRLIGKRCIGDEGVSGGCGTTRTNLPRSSSPTFGRAERAGVTPPRTLRPQEGGLDEPPSHPPQPDLLHHCPGVGGVELRGGDRTGACRGGGHGRREGILFVAAVGDAGGEGREKRIPTAHGVPQLRR